MKREDRGRRLMSLLKKNLQGRLFSVGTGALAVAVAALLGIERETPRAETAPASPGPARVEVVSAEAVTGSREVRPASDEEIRAEAMLLAVRGPRYQ